MQLETSRYRGDTNRQRADIVRRQSAAQIVVDVCNGFGRGFGLRHLNYNHLHYFWVVATSGSIAKAARSLHVTPQTISGQLRALEARVGAALFQRTAGKLGLSETGQMVHAYADAMFSLGWELGEVLQRRAPRRPSPLSIGVATALAKSIAYRVLVPAVTLAERSRVLCREIPTESLGAGLLAREIDLAVTDAPLPASDGPRLRSYLVGECGTTFLCASALAERYRAGFPDSLDRAPFVMPAGVSSLGKALSDWFRAEQIAPLVIAEIESPDLASVLCEMHPAVLALPTTMVRDAERKYGLAAIGEVQSIEQHFYVVCAEGAARPETVLSIVERVRERFRVRTPASCDRCASPVELLEECAG
jgi:LysR family transcriptional activator of nhaA